VKPKTYKGEVWGRSCPDTENIPFYGYELSMKYLMIKNVRIFMNKTRENDFKN